MAIKKACTDAYGQISEYWRIIKIDLSFTDTKAFIHVALYKNADARLAGMRVVEIRQFQAKPVDLELANLDNITAGRGKAYDYLKGLTFFSGAEDV